MNTAPDFRPGDRVIYNRIHWDGTKSNHEATFAGFTAIGRCKIILADTKKCTVVNPNRISLFDPHGERPPIDAKPIEATAHWIAVRRKKPQEEEAPPAPTPPPQKEEPNAHYFRNEQDIRQLYNHPQVYLHGFYDLEKLREIVRRLEASSEQSATLPAPRI